MTETLSIAHFWEQRKTLSADVVREQLKEHLNGLINHSTLDHLVWCELAEEMGAPALAFREAQLAVRYAPHRVEALKKLGVLTLERGQSQRATVYFEQALKHDPRDVELYEQLAELYQELGLGQSLRDLHTQSQLQELELPPQWFKPQDSALVPPEQAQEVTPETVSLPSLAAATRFLQAFAGREDLHARQWASRDGRGGYTPVYKPLTPRLIQGHLVGNETLGVYCLRADGTSQFMVLDLDITKATLEQALVNADFAQQVRQDLLSTTQKLEQYCKDLGLSPLIENSGYKGRHLWVFFEQPMPAEIVHTLGQLFLRKVHDQIPGTLHLEFFPKQPNLNTKKKLGNLVKLPLGIHQKSGRRSFFMQSTGETVSQWDRHLAEMPRASHQQLCDLIENLKGEDLPELIATPQPIQPQKPEAAPVQRLWTEADFETNAEVHTLFSRCAALRHLKKQVDQHRQLNIHEQVVLAHTLGHLRSGVLAANYLYQRAANVSADRFLQSPLRGNPISCPKIRKRIPHITSQVPCNCRFEADHYPTPLLHTQKLLTPEAKAEDSLEQLARRYATQQDKILQLQQEHSALGQQIMAQIKGQPDQRLVLQEGYYTVRLEDDIERLAWHPHEA